MGCVSAARWVNNRIASWGKYSQCRAKVLLFQARRPVATGKAPSHAKCLWADTQVSATHCRNGVPARAGSRQQPNERPRSSWQIGVRRTLVSRYVPRNSGKRGGGGSGTADSGSSWRLGGATLTRNGRWENEAGFCGPANRLDQTRRKGQSLAEQGRRAQKYRGLAFSWPSDARMGGDGTHAEFRLIRWPSNSGGCCRQNGRGGLEGVRTTKGLPDWDKHAMQSPPDVPRKAGVGGGVGWRSACEAEMGAQEQSPGEGVWVQERTGRPGSVFAGQKEIHFEEDCVAICQR